MAPNIRVRTNPHIIFTHIHNIPDHGINLPYQSSHLIANRVFSKHFEPKYHHNLIKISMFWHRITWKPIPNYPRINMLSIDIYPFLHIYFEFIVFSMHISERHCNRFNTKCQFYHLPSNFLPIINAQVDFKVF